MKHRVWPYEAQKHVPCIEGVSAPTAIELHFPETFSTRTRHLLEELEGTIALYLFRDRFIVTDEGCELTHPRWEGDSLDGLENWLVEQADIRDKEMPGWEEPYLASKDCPVDGVNRDVLATSFKEVLRIAKARGYERIEFPSVGMRYTIDEYIKEIENDEDADEAAYTLFGDMIIRVGDAWEKDADISQVLE